MNKITSWYGPFLLTNKETGDIIKTNDPNWLNVRQLLNVKVSPPTFPNDKVVING